jgi:predicted ATPase
MKKVIITGSPGSGKSTLLAALGKHFPVAEEVSREIITEQQNLQTDVSPWGDVEKFAEISLTRMIQLYERQRRNCCIYDRAIPDVIAALRHRNKEVDSRYHQCVETHLAGSLVFMAPPWEEIYIPDAQRPESFAQTLPMSKLLRKTYRELDFELVELPKESVATRVDFVKQTIGRIQPNEQHLYQ